jgi:predicted nucleic acid-binding protein
MRYILDTNAVSELMRGNVAVLARLRECSSQDVDIPQPVRAEIAFGLALMRRSRRRAELERRWGILSEELCSAKWTDAVSRCFAEIKAGLQRGGNLIEDFDIAIAAHALAVGHCLVTNNTRHLGRIQGIVLEDWSC